MEHKFYQIASERSVYEVLGNTGYRQVVYEGTPGVIYRKNDEFGYGLSSDDLICMCHPSLNIHPISRDYFNKILEEVNRWQS